MSNETPKNGLKFRYNADAYSEICEQAGVPVDASFGGPLGRPECCPVKVYDCPPDQDGEVPDVESVAILAEVQGVKRCEICVAPANLKPGSTRYLRKDFPPQFSWKVIRTVLGCIPDEATWLQYVGVYGFEWIEP